MSQITKKTRTARASQLQVTKMIDFFNINKGLAEGKVHALHGKEEAQKKLTQLTNELNSFQGATKTVEQWQVVWKDLKSRTSTKARELRKAKALTGNKSIKESELTELELRIIGMIGPEYIEGSKHCAESIPEEENLLEELENGNNSVLSATPQVMSICTNILQEKCQDLQKADSFYNNDGNSILSDNCSLSTVSEQNVIFEIGDSDDILNPAEDRKLRKAPKTATISSFKGLYTVVRPKKRCFL